MATNSYSDYPVVIFYPSNAVCDHGFLCGEVISDDLFKTKNFFIHEVVDTSSVPEDAIGIVGNISPKKTKIKNSDWIRLKSFEKLPVLAEVICNNVNVERENCQVVFYNQCNFLQSELLLPDCYRQRESGAVDDHFKLLIISLKHRQSLQNRSGGLAPLTKISLVTLIGILKHIDGFITVLFWLLKCSTLALHISAFVKNAIKYLELIYQRKSFTTLVSGNYILGIVADWFGGLLLIYWLMSIVNVKEILQILADNSEVSLT